MNMGSSPQMMLPFLFCINEYLLVHQLYIFAKKKRLIILVNFKPVWVYVRNKNAFGVTVCLLQHASQRLVRLMEYHEQEHYFNWGRNFAIRYKLLVLLGSFYPVASDGHLYQLHTRCGTCGGARFT
jgi:hypothetical protein